MVKMKNQRSLYFLERSLVSKTTRKIAQFFLATQKRIEALYSTLINSHFIYSTWEKVRRSPKEQKVNDEAKYVS